MEETKYKFVMYLDYDGVFNSENYFVKMFETFVEKKDDGSKDFYYRNFVTKYCFQKEAVECLNKVYDKVPFYVIMTATRRFEFTPTEWNLIFRLNDCKPYVGGRTGKSERHWREDEIEAYHFKDAGMFSMKDLPFIIIDDDTFDLQKYKDKLVHTDNKTGLTLDYYDEIIEKLKMQGVEIDV